MEQWDMRSKYLRRDTKVWNLSFAQFARMMETASASRRSKDVDTGDQPEDLEVDEIEDNMEETAREGQDKDKPWDTPFKKVMMCSHLCCTDQAKEDCEGVCCKSSPKRNKLGKKSKKVKRATDVPELMELREPYVGEPRQMKRRQMPAVLRFYKSNKDTNPVRFFLQELVLFVPFGLEENGDTQNLLQAPDDQIVLLYEKYSQHIKEVKRQVLPFLEDVMEQRFYVEEVRRQLDVEEIGKELAAGKELDNMEALDAEVRFDCLKRVCLIE